MDGAGLAEEAQLGVGFGAELGLAPEGRGGAPHDLSSLSRFCLGDWVGWSVP